MARLKGRFSSSTATAAERDSDVQYRKPKEKIEMRTTITNHRNGPFKFGGAPHDLLDVPGIDTLEFSTKFHHLKIFKKRLTTRQQLSLPHFHC